MQPVTQHNTINVAIMGQHSIFSETFKFVFFKSQKGKSYPICHDRGKERPKYLAPNITRSHTPQLFLVSIYSWKNTKPQIFSNMEHCFIVNKALYDRFCRQWSGRWAPSIIRFDNSQVFPMRFS